MGALLLAERIDSRLTPGDPVVLLGDFNAVANNPAMAYLTGSRVTLAGRAARWDSPLIDAYRAVNPRSGTTGTLHLWRGPDGPPWRIDHILVSGGARPTAAGIETAPFPGGYASDHHPVWATVRWE